MTRSEQIDQAAADPKNGDGHDYSEGFIAGALWADAHPDLRQFMRDGKFGPEVEKKIKQLEAAFEDIQAIINIYDP